MEFIVWDPVTGRERRIPDEVPDRYTNHAVLCAAGAGCDHSGCSGGPFLLACAGVFHLDFVQVDACFFSSEAGARAVQSTNLYLDYDRHSLEEDLPAALVGGALYYVGSSGTLLRYDVLGGRGLSVIKLPKRKHLGSVLAIQAEDGELGLACLYRPSLHLWSRETGAEGDAGWVRRRVIDLNKLLPVGSPKSPVCLSGFAEDVVFVSTDDGGVFTIDLKSLQVRKLCEMGDVGRIIPYVSFYAPAACARGTLPSAVGTSVIQ